jgi:hypothetical protein
LYLSDLCSAVPHGFADGEYNVERTEYLAKHLVLLKVQNLCASSVMRSIHLSTRLKQDTFQLLFRRSAPSLFELHKIVAACPAWNPTVFFSRKPTEIFQADVRPVWCGFAADEKLARGMVYRRWIFVPNQIRFGS